MTHRNSSSEDETRARLPLWAPHWLGLFLGTEDRQVVLDELAELYALRRRARGERGAARWLRRELLAYPLRLLGEGLRTGVGRACHPRPHRDLRRRGASLVAPLTDLRHATRMLRREPRFAATAVLTLALGVGATASVLTVTKRVLVDPLPYPDGEALAIVWSALPASGYERGPISGPELEDLRRRSRHFLDFASIWTTTATLVGEDEPRTLRLALVTANFLHLLGAEPLLGRGFAPGEEGPGAEPAIVLGEGLWRQRFAADPGVLGRSVHLDGGWGFPGGVYTVVGVLPSSFRLVLPGDAGVATGLDAWATFPFDLAHGDRGTYYLRTVGRVGPEATFELARDEVRAIGDELAAEYPIYAETGRAFDAIPLKGDVVAPARPTVLAVLAGVTVLLLISCSNVTSLLLARADARRSEIELRTALGASKTRIAALLLFESLLLAALGGAVGVVLGGWGVRALLALAPASLPRADALALDPSVLALVLALSLLCGMAFGVAPALASRRFQPAAGLRTGRSNVTPGPRARNVLVVAELAMVYVLSVGAILCLRTVERLESQDLGFDAGGVLSFELTLPAERYGDASRLARFSRELDRRLGSLPGVSAAGAVNQLPLSDLPNWSSPYRPRDAQVQNDEAFEADARVTTPGYLRAVRARLIEGRLFDERDDETSRHVVLVDRLLAHRTWPGESAVGKELEIEVRKAEGFVRVWAEVVGVIEHMRLHDPRLEVREQLWVPFSQGARNQMAVAVRGAGDPRSLLDPIREELRTIDPDLALSRIRLLDEYTADARSVQRFTLALVASFAALALLLGSVGLFGVVSYVVGLRRRDLGLRLALGSTTGRVVRLVLGHGLGLVALGIGLGLAGVFAARRPLDALLFGVSPTDPITFALIAALLGAVGALACWAPARRAVRIDPASLLRGE